MPLDWDPDAVRERRRREASRWTPLQKKLAAVAVVIALVCLLRYMELQGHTPWLDQFADAFSDF